MSNIDLKRFVDIDIIAHQVSGVESSRDTIVLFTNDTTTPDTKTQTLTLNSVQYNANLVDTNNYATRYTLADTPDTFAYLKVYFSNGGVKALVIEGMSHATLSTAEIADLNNKYILIGYAASVADIETVYGELKTIIATRNADSNIYGINEKIIFAGSSVKTDTDKIKNFAVKYTTKQGGEMTIPAYLSKINVYGLNTVFDYAFTSEILLNDSGKNILAENVNDTDFGTLMENNYNVDIELANAVRNAGGNCKDGSDLVNSYVKIILHQTLTDSLINLLTEKLKSGTGLAKIYTTISEELENYLNAGYLTTDKIWTDADYTITRNGVTYTIIEKGTPLINGYLITILPMSSLTQEEKTAHSTPPIYVIIADQYGIRKITINGEVI